MRALAVGDNHFGAGADLGREPGERLAEQAENWRRALAIAREEDCDVVLHGGDLFHKVKPSPQEVLAATRPLVEHRVEGGCPVVMALGNHERSGASEETMPAVLALGDLMHVSHSPEIVGAFGGATVCTLPWSPTAWIVASEGGGDRDGINALAAELLVAIARGLREQVSGPAVLLTHFSISGSSLPNGLPVDQLREPVLELGELEQLGFDAIVAAHIHAPQVLDGPPAYSELVTGRTLFYVGSPMPLSFGETGTEHGVWILDTGRWTATFVPIASRPLVTLDLEAGEGQAGVLWPAMWDGALEGAIVKARVQVTQEQARRLDVPALKRALLDAGAHKVWAVQLEIEKPERARVEGLHEELSEIDALRLWLESQSINGSQADELIERTETYMGIVRA